MFRKFFAMILTLALLICAVPLAAKAETMPPATFSAPEHFGVSYYVLDSVYFTFSAPEDLREYIEKWKADDVENHINMTVYFQVDYRVDNGNWHHTKDWDSPGTVPYEIKSMYLVLGKEGHYIGSESRSLSSLFPGDADLVSFRESGWDYLKNHSITLRVRFAQSFDYGQTYVLSPWSKEFTLSANVKEDCDKLINNAPSLVSAELKTKPGGEPYFNVRLGEIPGDVQYLHAITGGSVRTEVWMRKGGDKEFKYIFYKWTDYVSLDIEASDYFSVDGTKQSYDEESYEIKVRYSLDMDRYKQAERSDEIYGPFSNVISHNMPAWSNASSWALGELGKAGDAGLIPDILNGTDLTKPITREEFCELALLLYEKSTGKSAEPVSPNPFTDTKNRQVLKAYTLGITQGTSATTFSPDMLINREQCATMLFRTIKAISPGGNFSIDGVPDFPDQKDISAFAVEGTKYMSKLGIIKGDSAGNFMPKATTSAQEASGYGMATREAAILMSVRTYEKLDEIQAETKGSVSPDTSASIAGTWILGSLSGGQFNAATGKYEGGATGLGQRYTFNNDGTYTSLAIWSNAIFFTGRYSIKDGKITLTNRTAEESNDGGKTWGAKETLPETSAYFTTGSDAAGKYLLLGQEGAVPPLVDKGNALKYVMLNQ